MVPFAAATAHRARIARYLAPAALVGVLATTVVVLMSPPGHLGTHHRARGPAHTSARPLPSYWTVHPGDTYAHIAAKTGLSVTQLQAFNPHTDPIFLQPGQRLNLWAHPPKPRPKSPGPEFWTVHTGQSFGSIAAHTGVNLAQLEALNPALKPTTLQPGDRVRLRP